MKPLIFIILITMLYSTTSCAQKRFAEGVVQAKRESFSVKKSPIINNQGHLFIYPEKNKYKNGLPSPKENYQFRVLQKDIHVNIDRIKEIVNTVLKDKKELLHAKNEFLRIRMVFETNGTLTDNNYTLIENSIITPADIELIDNQLRSEIKATFTGIDYTHYIAVNFTFKDIRF